MTDSPLASDTPDQPDELVASASTAAQPGDNRRFLRLLAESLGKELLQIHIAGAELRILVADYLLTMVKLHS